MSSITYILQMDGPGRYVKFGRTHNPQSRITTLKTGIPWPLRIVALIGADVERDLKREYAEHRVQGEWFRPTEKLRDWLLTAASEGRLVKQVAVNGAYINAVIKPRIREYLGGREPLNNHCGDLVRCVLSDLLPTIAGREREIVAATKGQVNMSLLRGFGPTNEVPVLHLDEAPIAQSEAA